MIARLAGPLTRDKADTLLLLLGALMVLAPHFAHLPLWTSATVCLTLLWRAAITLRGSRLPPLWLLLPVSLLAMGGVYLNYRTLLGREPGVTMLTLLLTFKLLEMHARRDLFVVIFLSFFLLLTNFFYSQSIPTAAMMIATIIVLLATQVTFQYTGAVPPLATRLKLASRVFLIAAPLGALLFIGFPRIQGPLWGLPGDAAGGKTGMSDTMAPGSMSNLALSEEVAFRARFQGAAPQQQQLYWRGPVLSRYDGRTWSRIGRPLYSLGTARLMEQLEWRGTPIPYEVTLEPGRRQFLFMLEMSGPARSASEGSGAYSDELEQLVQAPADKRMRYTGVAHPDYIAQAGLSPQQLQRWLELPQGFNPRTLRYAAQLQTLRAEKGDDAALAAALDYFRREFEYTLQPSLLGRDAVDEFLFDTRKGFCEHFAGAFVYLMRATGLPARVVTGYQGGELNPVDGYYTVRQSDAHAWSEVWLGPQRGWTRVDPTAAVAPERIRSSLAQTLPEAAPFGLQGLAGLARNQDSWLAKMRFGISAMNNAWNQWILDYNPNRQQHFLRELGAAFGDWRLPAALAAIGGLVLLLRRGRAERARDPVDAAYLAFCRLLARHGLEKAPDEGPQSLAQRVRQLTLPSEKMAAMTGFLELYGALKYGLPQAPANQIARLNSLLKQSR
ncbi:transglutaminase TgpA family protein [Pseudoduganella sp. OTU4001]|uniref:transglutaminase TgpA family protein n=1 Tax=Pseudoduganella sp. OTU4001 TaxID=3043854 RepID=UPI00313CB397